MLNPSDKQRVVTTEQTCSVTTPEGEELVRAEGANTYEAIVAMRRLIDHLIAESK